MPLLPPHPSTRQATAVLMGSALLWGLSWMPLKGFAHLGLSGPIVPLLAYGLVGLATAGWIWHDRALWWPQRWRVLALALVGGWANSAFVNALMLGDVVRAMFLFYLAPIWSVLGGWLFLREQVPPGRWLAVGLAMPGLWLLLGVSGSGTTSQLLSGSDALALSAGIAFAGNNLVARAANQVPLRTKTFSVFLGCAAVSAVAALVWPLPLPDMGAVLWLALIAYGFGWLMLGTVTWQYGVSHLESSRAGLILLGELMVAVLTATWWGGESLSPTAWIGGLLIAAAAAVDARA